MLHWVENRWMEFCAHHTTNFRADTPRIGDSSFRWSSHSADYSILVVRSLQRKGRIRSAERTEVHLVTIIRLCELTFCP
jgi:hypothetical protein